MKILLLGKGKHYRLSNYDLYTLLLPKYTEENIINQSLFRSLKQ